MSGFAAVAGGEAKFGTVFGAGPVEHGVPEGRANALAADARVGDEVFEIGDAADDGPHDDGESGDADDVVVVVEGEKHIVGGGRDEVFEPLTWYFPAVFAAP